MAKRQPPRRKPKDERPPARARKPLDSAAQDKKPRETTKPRRTRPAAPTIGTTPPPTAAVSQPPPRVEGEQPMPQDIAGYPHWEARFDEGGQFLDAGAIDQFLHELPAQGLTDLFIFSHGWNNDPA